MVHYVHVSFTQYPKKGGSKKNLRLRGCTELMIQKRCISKLLTATFGFKSHE